MWTEIFAHCFFQFFSKTYFFGVSLRELILILQMIHWDVLSFFIIFYILFFLRLFGAFWNFIAFCFWLDCFLWISSFFEVRDSLLSFLFFERLVCFFDSNFFFSSVQDDKNFVSSSFKTEKARNCYCKDFNFSVAVFSLHFFQRTLKN